MQTEWLRTFVAIVDTGSLTLAAEQLEISQPAVSKQMKHLESYFGAELKYWNGRELRLTETGYDVLAFARQFLRELERLTRDVESRSTNRKKSVIITAGPTLVLHYLPLLVESARLEAPDIRLSTLTIVDQRDLTEAVREGRADIALHSGFFSHPLLECHPVINDRLVLVANPGHPFVGRPKNSARELAEQQLCVLARSTEARRLVDDWFETRGLNVSQRLEFGSHAEVRAQLLANRTYIGVASRITVIEDIKAGALVEVGVEGFELPRFLYASHRAEPSESIQIVLRLMTAAFAASGPRASRDSVPLRPSV
ncbi:MAG: LysR family transcriptional regulator [Dehalococcoidia bacterium]